MVSGAGAGWLTEIILYTASVSGDSAKNAGMPLASFKKEPAKSQAEAEQNNHAALNRIKMFDCLFFTMHYILLVLLAYKRNSKQRVNI